MENTQSATIRAYEEKIGTQLQQAKAALDQVEARVKGKAAQSDIDVIQRLKTKHQEIERRRQELKTAGEAKVEQIKSQIDAELAKLKSSVAEVAAKVEHAKAS